MCLAVGHALAQSASAQMGARSQGIGYASGCVEDVWAMTNNIAGLANGRAPVAAVSYNALPSFTPFNRMAAVFALPLLSGNAGVSAFRFGDDLYAEQTLSLGYADRFGLASLGVKLNYLEYRAEGFTATRALTLSFGGIATITPDLLFGAHIVNVNQPIVNELTGERAPTILFAGIAAKLSEKLMVAAELEKHLQHMPVAKAGFEYKAHRKITFRTGFNLNPQAGFLGLGFNVKRFDLDYAMQLTHAFGLSHQATVTIPFGE